MIVQVVTDTWEIVNHRDADGLEVLSWSHAAVQ
jgi:hypothetical protein